MAISSPGHQMCSLTKPWEALSAGLFGGGRGAVRSELCGTAGFCSCIPWCVSPADLPPHILMAINGSNKSGRAQILIHSGPKF